MEPGLVHSTPPARRATRARRPLGSFSLVACALLALAGCTQHHYLVRDAELPLYASPSGDEVLATLPRFHHEPLEVDPAETPGARVPLSYRGQPGWAPRAGLLLFEYLDPDLDDGRDRGRELRRALREAQLEAFGRDWPEEVVLAIREGHVRRGMTPRQVEVAWGWPSSIESTPGGSRRWTYERRRTEIVQEPVGFSAWQGPIIAAGPAWRLDYTWTIRREQITERRVVIFDPSGHVHAILLSHSRR